MALLSIQKNLSVNSSVSQLIPTGEIFENILQAVLHQQERVGGSSSQSLNGSFFTNHSPILATIKDYSHLLNSTTSLNYSEVSIEKLNAKLKGKLSNMGAAFIEAGRKYNMNPSLLASIAIHETGNGKSRAANEKNNIAGMMGKNGLKLYESVEESIFDMARNLRKNYLDKGLDTIAKIGAKYAPVGAANDPTGLNNHWVKGVNNYFHSFLS